MKDLFKDLGKIMAKKFDPLKLSDRQIAIEATECKGEIISTYEKIVSNENGSCHIIYEDGQYIFCDIEGNEMNAELIASQQDIINYFFPEPIDILKGPDIVDRVEAEWEDIEPEMIWDYLRKHKGNII